MKWLINILLLTFPILSQQNLANVETCKAGSNSFQVIICPKYGMCFSDSGTVLLKTVQSYILVRKNNTRREIERANLDTIEY